MMKCFRTINQIEKELEKELPPKRFKHTLGVVDSAIKMGMKYGANLEKIKYAALLHDCAKNLTNSQLIKEAIKTGIPMDTIASSEPQLLHGPIGAIKAKEFYGIEDIDVLNAIYYHTTGRAKMSKLEKIVYIADYIEPSRTYPGVDDLRKIAYENLDAALLLALTNTLSYILSINGLIHENTINARNYLLL